MESEWHNKYFYSYHLAIVIAEQYNTFCYGTPPYRDKSRLDLLFTPFFKQPKTYGNSSTLLWNILSCPFLSCNTVNCVVRLSFRNHSLMSRKQLLCSQLKCICLVSKPTGKCCDPFGLSPVSHCPYPSSSGSDGSQEAIVIMTLGNNFLCVCL